MCSVYKDNPPAICSTGPKNSSTALKDTSLKDRPAITVSTTSNSNSFKSDNLNIPFSAGVTSSPNSASTASSMNSNLSHMNLGATSTSNSTPSYLSPHLPTGFPLLKSPINKSPTSIKSPINTKFNANDLPIHKLSVNDLSNFITSESPIIIDIRCYNQFLSFKLKNSYNICIPSTLLKRPSYKLPNIVSSFNLSDELKDLLLNVTNNPKGKIKLLFIDSSSTDLLNYPLYQTISKFLNYSSNYDIWYLDKGIDNVPKDLDLFEFESPISSPKSCLSDVMSQRSNVNSNSANYTTEPPSLLAGFQLPSSTPSNLKFLSSLKKNVPRLDLQSIKDQEEIKNYNYDFHFPNKTEHIDKLPIWLKNITFDKNNVRYKSEQIIKHLNIKFNKIEKIEQIRLNLAITDNHKVDENHSAYCSPSTPCPQCDDITYKIPKGIEYGFKNRYNNIWPYEHSRVKLIRSPCICNVNKDSAFDDKLNFKVEDYLNFDDYFNGNYIHYPKISNFQYVATQNPLPATYKDFWDLIWNNGIKLIVCLNSQNLLQSNYFDNQKLDNLEVTLLNEKLYDQFNLREVKLTKKGEKCTVYHLEYKNWPDFGVPDMRSLIEFINYKNLLIKDHKLGNQSVVHCSAGCGRTGCYIAIDLIIDLIQSHQANVDEMIVEGNEEKFDPFGDIDLIYKSIQFQRTQRISMCQNFDQYIVCYETILKYLLEYVL